MWQRLFVWNVDKNFLAVNSSDVIFFPCALLYQVDRRPPWHGSHENFSPWIITTPHNLPSGKTFFEIAYELSYFFDMKNSKSKESNKKVSNLVEVPSSFPPNPLENGHFLLYFVYGMGNNLQYTGNF